MSDLKLSGKIYKIFPTNQVSEKFKKREIVLETESDKYPQLVKFELTQDNCSKADDLQTNQECTFHFNVRGREYINKENVAMYFVTLNVWRIESVVMEKPKETEPPKADHNDKFADDLPF